MKKLLLFIAAAVFAASAAVAQEVPQVEPVENGITIVVHIPEGTDCHGAPLWGGDTNNWSGEEMQAIDGYPNWYKLDVPGVSSLEGLPLANFEGWENGLGLWEMKVYDYEVLWEYTTAACYLPDGEYGRENFYIEWQGIVYIDVKSWLNNPCISDREFKFTIVVPECTPDGQETVNIVGAFDEDPETDGIQSWGYGIDFPIVDGKAEITITGQETTEWKVRLTGNVWSDQAVHCEYGESDDIDDIVIVPDNNRTLGEAEGQEIYVEGWGDSGYPLEGCGCEEREFKFTVVVPECTPADKQTLYVYKNVFELRGQFPIIDGRAEVSVVGYSINPLMLSIDSNVYGWAPVHCEFDEESGTYGVHRDIYSLGEAEVMKELFVEGWGRDNGGNVSLPLEGCLADCQLPEYEIVMNLPDCTPRDAQVMISEWNAADIDWETMTATATIRCNYDAWIWPELQNGNVTNQAIEYVLMDGSNGELYYDVVIHNVIVLEEPGTYKCDIIGWEGIEDCGVPCEPLELEKVSGYAPEMYVGEGVATYKAVVGDEDVTELATWSSDDERVATVDNGVVTPIAAGNATIWCEYGEQRRRLDINVKPTPEDLKNGSDYYVFLMGETTFNELEAQGKITADLRANGHWEGETLVPADATRVILPSWNLLDWADAPQVGLNSFGEMDSWFSVASVDPTPDGGWGNICGGVYITTAEDDQVSKLKSLTPEHEFVVVLKGEYTPERYLDIGMSPLSGGVAVCLLYITEPTGINNDGGWEAFTLSYEDLLSLGLDFSQEITTEQWNAWTFLANGAGNRVDIDAVFFYVPAEEEEPTAIGEEGTVSESIAVTARDGRIYCDEDFRIVNLAGQDVTAMNGELHGTYIVVSGDKAVKVVVR